MNSGRCFYTHGGAHRRSPVAEYVSGPGGSSPFSIGGHMPSNQRQCYSSYLWYDHVGVDPTMICHPTARRCKSLPQALFGFNLGHCLAHRRCIARFYLKTPKVDCLRPALRGQCSPAPRDGYGKDGMCEIIPAYSFRITRPWHVNSRWVVA